MGFDQEQVQQLRNILREEVPVIVTPIVTKIVGEAEERIVQRITTSVGEMIEDNILPQFTEIREDIAGIKGDIVIMKGDITNMKEDITVMKGDIVEMKEDIADIHNGQAGMRGEIAGLKSARWRLA